MPPHCSIAPNEIALNNGAYIVIFTPKNVFRGGGGEGRVASNPCLADLLLLSTRNEGATVSYKCRDRESLLTYSKHQTADTTWLVEYLPRFTLMWL